MMGILTSRTATRHTACLSLERKTIGWLNFSTLKPADFSKRPSALSTKASSSMSQIGLQPSTREDEAHAPDSSRCFNEESNSGIYLFIRIYVIGECAAGRILQKIDRFLPASAVLE